MSLTLRFSFDVEFDSPETAKAFGVSLGWTVGAAANNALALSDAPGKRIDRQPFRVEVIDPAGHG